MVKVQTDIDLELYYYWRQKIQSVNTELNNILNFERLSVSPETKSSISILQNKTIKMVEETTALRNRLLPKGLIQETIEKWNDLLPTDKEIFTVCNAILTDFIKKNNVILSETSKQTENYEEFIKDYILDLQNDALIDVDQIDNICSLSDSGYKLSLISLYNHRILQSDQIRNVIVSTDSLYKKYANLKRYDVFKKSGVSNFPSILHDFQDRLILELDNVIKKIKGSDQSIVLDQILNDWNTRIDSLEANLPLIQQYLTQLKEAIVYSEVNETYSNELNLLQKQIINAEFEKIDIKINIFNRIDQFDTFLKNHRRNTIHEVELYTLVGKEISEDPFFQKIIKPKLYEIRPSADSGPHQVSTDNTKISSWILRELETKIVLPFFQIQYEIGKVDTELLETLSNSTMDVLIHKEHLVNMKQFTQASSARKKWILKNNPVVYDLI